VGRLNVSVSQRSKTQRFAKTLCLSKVKNAAVRQNSLGVRQRKWDERAPEASLSSALARSASARRTSRASVASALARSAAARACTACRRAAPLSPPPTPRAPHEVP